jgi:MarR family transcriptional regulator, lower aerobic nicotinate degradation pathway regulator
LGSLSSWLIDRTAVRARRLATTALATGGRPHHYVLLAALAESGPSSQASLGRRCGLDRGDVADMINELAHGAYVAREPDPADRRRGRVALTAAGAVRLAELDGLIAGIQDDLLAPLSPVERAELVRLLTLVVDHQPDQPHARGGRPGGARKTPC